MKWTKLLTILVAVYCLLPLSSVEAQKKKKAAPIDLKGKTLAQVFEELLPGMNAFGQQQQQWQNLCFQAGAAGNETLRAEACKLMIDRLGPKTPTGARLWLLKQLEHLGRGESVGPVAALLDAKDDLLRDAAVRCLANNPAPEATAALTAKLPAASAKAKIGLLNALGYRGDATAVIAVAKELEGDTAVAVAAARALARFATPEAARLLGAAQGKAKEGLRREIGDALLRCADQRLKEGNHKEALAIYKALVQAKEPRFIRLAALNGLLKSSGDAAGYLLLGILRGVDPDSRDIALAAIETIDPGPIKVLAQNLGNLSVESQVLVLGALAARGDRSQVGVAVGLTKSSEEKVRRAAILALGRLGDGSVVSPLLDVMFADQKLGGAAKDSLSRLVGDEVDQKLVVALQKEENVNRRVALIGILEARRTAAAVPILLEDMRHKDGGVRASALAALRLLAEARHLPAMIQTLLKAEKGRERDEAENTIVAVCKQISDMDQRTAPLLAALRESTGTNRVTLLPILGRVGGAKALAALRETLAGDDAEQYAAAVRGLCSWPDLSASTDLLKLAQAAKEQGQRQQALRALIRVNAIANEGDNAAKLAMLQKAMDLAVSKEDKKLVFDGLGTVKEMSTLRYVLPYLDSKDYAQMACRTVVELAHSKKLREPNRAEFHKALDRVIAICKDRGLLDRAQKYKQGQ